ncbi:hypothetical protein RDABS01_017244, partial [Bienertia sinuspersici]
NQSASNGSPQMSNANDGPINKAPRKEVNPLHTSLIESLNQDVHEDDMLQSSINNDALSRFIDESASEGDPRMHEEDRTICPVRVHSWDEIEPEAKEHMWQSVLNKFNGKGIPLDRTTIIDHMKRLWHNWRGILSQNSIKKGRGNLTMPHRTGSMPFRQVIWEDVLSKNALEIKIAEVLFALGLVFDLTTRLHEKEKENDDLRKRIDEMEKTHQVEHEANAKKNQFLRRKVKLYRGSAAVLHGGSAAFLHGWQKVGAGTMVAGAVAVHM